MPVTLVSRLTSRTPRPPLRSSGTGVALSVSRTTSTSRSRSIAAPAATASTSAVVVVDTTGSGAVSPTGPGSSPRNTWPTSLGRITVSASTWRSSPAASSRCTGRSGGVPGSGVAGAAHRRALQQLLQQLGLRLVECRRGARRCRVGSVSSTVACPGYQGRPDAASATTRTAVVAPHQRALTKFVDGRRDRGLGAASPTSSSSLVSGTAVGVGMQDQQRVEHRQMQEVQVIGGGLDRLAGLRPGRQRRDGARRGLCQVGPQLQQPDQPLIVQFGQPGAQRDARSVFGHC